MGKQDNAGSLADNFISLFSMDELLENCRMANNMYIFKEGCKDMPGYYRLVSITLAVGNKLEDDSE